MCFTHRLKCFLWNRALPKAIGMSQEQLQRAISVQVCASACVDLQRRRTQLSGKRRGCPAPEQCRYEKKKKRLIRRANWTVLWPCRYKPCEDKVAECNCQRQREDLRPRCSSRGLQLTSHNMDFNDIQSRVASPERTPQSASVSGDENIPVVPRAALLCAVCTAAFILF